PSSSVYDVAYHRDLHSFPTRRSSDLGSMSSGASASPCPRRISSSAVGSAGGSSGLVAFAAGCSCASSPASSSGLVSSASPMKVRSEEHTSELQSRENLVCRLLLEKKK